MRKNQIGNVTRHNVQYRDLIDTDAAAMRQLRLTVLRSDELAFSVSEQEETQVSSDMLASILNTYHTNNEQLIHGAFDDTLVGMIGAERLQGEFTRHKARIWGLYVLQSHRRHGIGTALLAHALQYLKSLGGVDKVVLEVTGESKDAVRLYERFGFSVFSSEADAQKRSKGYVEELRMQLHLNR